MTGSPASLTEMPRLEPGWSDALAAAFATAQAEALRDRLRAEEAAGHQVFPPCQERYAAFELTPLAAVRVVVVGQDPYHAPGQAMGLSFSVPRGVRVPPSLRNIHAELERDLGIAPARHGDLTAWARRGILLLNTSLSVRAGEAGSHARIGWEPITDAAIRAVSERRDHVAFLLWGRHAQSKAALVDETRHLVLRAPHPSPLSAHTGFLGCGHFTRVDEWFAKLGMPPIDWSLPE